MTQIIFFPAATLPAAPCAAAVQDVPASGVAAPFVQWLDPATLPAIVDDRPDLHAQLSALPEPVVVTLPAKLVTWAIAAACIAYCVAIWCGWAK